MGESGRNTAGIAVVAAVLVAGVYIGQHRVSSLRAVPFGELSLEPSLQSHDDGPSVSSQPTIGTSVSWRSYVKDPKNFPLTAYDDALCDAPGQAQPLCHESPGIPSPRTPWSAYTAAQLDTWFDVQGALTRDAADAEQQHSVDVAFVGDSIFESFRGSSYGKSCETKRCRGVPTEFQAAFGKLRSVVLAISGDQVQHVLWRVITANENGHVPGGGEFEVLRPKVVVLLIGTNNLGAGMNPPLIAAAIDKLTTVLAGESKATEVVVLPLLARGHGGRQASQPRVAEINRLLRGLLSPKVLISGAGSTAARVTVSECGGMLVTDATRSRPEPDWVVNRTLLPDGLHPGAAGAKVWLRCLAKEIEATVARVTRNAKRIR